MKTSAFLSLNLKDFLLGLLFSILVPIIAVIEDSLKQGQLYFNWDVIIATSIASAIAYIKIALFSGSKSNKLVEDIGLSKPKDPKTNP